MAAKKTVDEDGIEIEAVEEAPKRVQLVPKAVPARTRGGGSSLYIDIVEEFVEADIESAQIEADKKAVTIVQGLRKAIEGTPFEEFVAVTQRGSEVYLVNKLLSDAATDDDDDTGEDDE
jgi:hypothetical protein